MAYFNICPDCGCTLDPNEKCDCGKEALNTQNYFQKRLKAESDTGQLVFKLDGGEDGNEKKKCS